MRQQKTSLFDMNALKSSNLFIDIFIVKIIWLAKNHENYSFVVSSDEQFIIKIRSLPSSFGILASKSLPELDRI